MVVPPITSPCLLPATLPSPGSADTINKTSGTLNLNTVDNQAITTGTGLFTVGGDLTVSGGDITGANSAAIDLGEAVSGNIAFYANGDTSDYVYLNTAGNEAALYFENAAQNYANDVGIRVNGTSGKLEFRDEDSASWTAFDSLAAAPGGSSNWQLNDAALSPNISSYDLLIGATSTASALFRAAGIAPTTGIALDLNANSLTTGTGFDLSSTSLNLTTGKLAYFNWEPSSPATASGDLFTLNIGAHGDLTGNLFNITDAGSSLFKVSTSKITSGLPHEFTAAGDVSMAYDLVLTNQTASQLQSYGPLTISSGESFENNNLTLKTFGSGDVIFDNDGSSIAILTDTAQLGLGTTAPGFKLHVTDTQAATASAIIENSNTGTDADGLMVKLGFTGAGTATNNFVTFLNGNGVIHGKINSTGSSGVNYATSGVDFAEYFVKDNSVFTEGELVAVNNGGATKTTGEYQSNMIGIVSNHPGFTGGVEGPDKVLVGIVGQVPVLISSNSAPINAGDLLTSSGDTSKAMKATKPGHVVGKALESWTPSSGKSSIMAYINVGYGDPNNTLAFDASGNLTLGGNVAINGTLTLNSDLIVQGRNILNQLDTLNATLITQAGHLNVLESAVSTMSATLASINTKINNMDNSFMTTRLGIGISAPASDSGKAIDTASGAYLSDSGVWTNVSDANKKTNYQSVDKDVILDKIANLSITQWNYITDSNNIVHIGPTAQDFHAAFGLGADNTSISTIDPAGIALVGIQALNAKFDNYVAAQNSVPTPSPTPTIDPLIARIESLEATVATLSALPEAQSVEREAQLDISDLLNSSTSAEIVQPSEIDMLATDLELLKQDLEIASLSATLQSQPLLLTETNSQGSLDALIVSGDTILNNVGITGTITAGVLEIDGLTGTISTIVGPLQLQTNALAGNIEAFNGAIVMTSKGDITINGTLTAEKVITQEIETNRLTATGAVLGKLTIATEAAQLATNSAIARANDDLSLPEATSSAILIPSIGTAEFPADQTLLLVENTGVTAASKVFITPIGFVDQVISVVDVLPGQGFVVGISRTSNKPITFNWWIIN
jgi:hypothetical protein